MNSPVIYPIPRQALAKRRKAQQLCESTPSSAVGPKGRNLRDRLFHFVLSPVDAAVDEVERVDFQNGRWVPHHDGHGALANPNRCDRRCIGAGGLQAHGVHQQKVDLITITGRKRDFPVGNVVVALARFGLLDER